MSDSSQGITKLKSLTISGNLVVAGTETITGGVTYAGAVTLGDASADAITINGTTTANAPITVGVDGTGHDFKAFGDTTSKFITWDASADDLILADGVALQLGGDESTADGFKIEFDGTDKLLIDALTADDSIQVGSSASTDFVLNSSGGSLTWDASADTLAIASVTTTFTGGVDLGVDDSGQDLRAYGATTGVSMHWDESADTLKLKGGAGFTEVAASVTPNNDSGPSSKINAGVRAVDVQAVTNDANDWIELPNLATVPVGHAIKIACNSGTNFELRTVASSSEKINNVISDGAQEYLCTDTDTVIIWKLSDADGWVAQSITNLGAVRTAVVPD